MASWINRGENVFFQFRNGKSVLNSQCKPRMFKTAEKATLGVNYVDTDVIVEYAEQKHGRLEETVEDWMMCSACGDEWNRRIVPIEDFHYCPNCGAKMDGDSHD